MSSVACHPSPGGGLSYFGGPAYQSNAIETLLDTLGDQTYAGLYN